LVPPITIGMPVYNGEPYVDAALGSILGQTFGDFCLIVSDNGSTDATEEIVRARAREDGRIRYLREPENRGAAWNFNRVFEESRSPFFKWAAADDLLAPTCVERCYEVLREAPDTVVLVAPRTRFIGPDGSFLGDVDERMEVTERTPQARLRHVVRNVLWGNTAFGLMRSDAMRRTRMVGTYKSSDWVLLAELALQGELRVIHEPLFFRREHEGTTRTAQSTTEEVARWLDPNNGKHARELPRVFVEFLRGTEHAPLSRISKLRCHVSMAIAFAARHARIRDRVAVRTRLRALVRRPGQ
jgi:glycosyltransferase involved in cell wall biosynthesis